MSFEEVMHGKRWENAIDNNKKEEWQIRAKISFQKGKKVIEIWLVYKTKKNTKKLREIDH